MMSDLYKLDLQRLKRVLEITSGITGNIGLESLAALKELNQFMQKMEQMIECDYIGPFSIGPDFLTAEGETE